MNRIPGPGAPLSWSYSYDNMYELSQWGKVILCIRAYGPDAFVVDKHRTALVSKSTTNLDRFDRYPDQEGLWVENSNKANAITTDRMCRALNEIAEHHKSYLAKLIVE